MKIRPILVALPVLLASGAAADVGNPQVKTGHPWYPGKGAATRWVDLDAVHGN